MTIEDILGNIENDYKTFTAAMDRQIADLKEQLKEQRKGLENDK